MSSASLSDGPVFFVPMPTALRPALECVVRVFIGVRITLALTRAYSGVQSTTNE